MATSLVLVVFARERPGPDYSQCEENKPCYFQPEDVQDTGKGIEGRFQAAEDCAPQTSLACVPAEDLRCQPKLPNSRDTGQTSILAVSGNEIRG